MSTMVRDVCRNLAAPALPWKLLEPLLAVCVWDHQSGGLQAKIILSLILKEGGVNLIA
jgi:hypothetical protein